MSLAQDNICPSLHHHLRSILAWAMLGVCIWTNILGYWVLQSYKKYIKTKNEMYVVELASEKKLDTLYIYNNNTNKIKWVKKNEFIYLNKYFDVHHYVQHNDYSIYYGRWDIEEDFVDKAVDSTTLEYNEECSRGEMGKKIKIKKVEDYICISKSMFGEYSEVYMYLYNSKKNLQAIIYPIPIPLPPPKVRLKLSVATTRV